MTRLEMGADMWAEFGNKLIPDPEQGKNTIRAERARDKILSLSQTGRGQDIPGVIGTGYAALNAVTEYVNYHRSSKGTDQLAKQSNRFKSTMFGQSNVMVGNAAMLLNGFLVDHGIQVDMTAQFSPFSFLHPINPKANSSSHLVFSFDKSYLTCSI